MLNEKAENLKKDLAEVILRTEVTYCFNTEYDFNLTFDEASDKLKRIVEELRTTKLDEIIFNYGTDYFPEELKNTKKACIQSQLMKFLPMSTRREFHQ